ncbi:hypothetical protein [Streptomyces sp. NPDC002265]|uniref:hypothetical protein n=1 Tax=Streptomyces sp. NPDC002265 TaxID=3154415 RepID=UPI003330A852
MKTQEWPELLAGMALILLERLMRQHYGVFGPLLVLSLSIGLRAVKAPPGWTLCLVFVWLSIQA